MINRETRMALDGKVAIITGASLGIGAAVVRRFAAEGAKIIIADINSVDGEKLADELKASARFKYCDVTQIEQIRDLMRYTIHEFGKLDILVNNAAIQSIHNFDQTTEDEFDKIVAVNLKGAFFGIKEALPFMRKNGGGSIINTSSTFALVGSPGYAVYHATKGGVSALTRGAAASLINDKIRVNAVCPGTTMTEGFLKSIRDTADNYDETLAEFASLQPMKRFGRPDEIAGAYVYLGSEDSSFVTGAELVVDGAYTIV